MFEGKRVVAVIPARGGSKGIPGKNIIDLGGKPLIAHSVEFALSNPEIDMTVVSTDDEDIAQVARRYGASVPLLRPAELASDTAKTVDAVEHMLASLEDRGQSFDIVVLLQPTQPFRRREDLLKALTLFKKRNEAGVLSLSLVRESPILMRQIVDDTGVLKPLLNLTSTVRRQDMSPYYRVNGAFYVNKRSDYAEKTSLNDNPCGFESSVGTEIDIDSMEDLVQARLFCAEKR